MRILPFSLFLLIASMPCRAWGQSLSPADSTEAAGWMAFSRMALAKNRPDSAVLYEKRARDVFGKNNDLAGWMKAVFSHSRAMANEMNRPLDALHFVRQSQSSAWRSPKNDREWKAKISLNNLAGHISAHKLGDFQLARTFYEQSFDDFNAHLGPAEKMIAYYIFGELGNICTRLGDYERARILLTQKVALATINADHQKAATGLHDLAIVFQELGLIDSAIALEHRSLAQPIPENPYRPMCLNGLAGYFLLKNDLNAAEKACQEARTAFRKLPKDKQGAVAHVLGEIAENEAKILLARGQFAAAKARFSQSLRLTAADLGGENRRETAKIRIQIGEIELMQGNPTAALAQFQTALQNVIPGFFEKNPAKNPLPGQFYPENTIREALDGKAQAWQAIAYAAKKLEKPLKCGNQPQPKRSVVALQNALECHTLIEEIEQKLRETYQFESSSLQALAEGRARLERATDIAHALFVATGDAKFSHQAFLFCEKSKGLLLLQGIARARSDFQLPKDLRFREQSVNSRVAFLEKNILEKKAAATGKKAPIGDGLRQLEDELLQAKQARQKFWDELKTASPEYWKISQAPNWATATDLRDLLVPGQDLVEYLIGEEHVFVFRANKDGHFSVRKTALPTDFLTMIDSLRSFLGKYDPSPAAQARFIETADSLFELLLGPEMADPVFSKNKRLLVVPDGVLGFVPFEVLLENLPANFAQNLAQKPAFINWAGLDFLLNKKAISYAWSASLLREQMKKMPVAGLKNLAAFVPDYSIGNVGGAGFPAGGARSSDGNLPGAQAESEAIERLVGGRFFRKNKATRANFLHWAGQFRILHLAMHAEIDAEDPAMSHLLFSPEKGQAAGANLLYVNDLQQIPLRAELAVLSACNTGNGRLHRGEGVYSLARGFALAGVSATLMSLWRLSDDSTPELMSVFYQKIKEGQRKDDALRSAKMEWLTGGGAPLFKHPYFWAGMVANGNMRPMELPGGGHIWWWVVIFGLATGVLGWFSVKYKIFSKLKSIFAAAKI